MTPEAKIHAYAVSLTIAVMYYLLMQLSGIISNYSLISILLAAFTSYGTYRFSAFALLTVLRKNRWVKKRILGPTYMEGTWAGFFIGKNNDVRYIIETFEQDIATLIIRGKVFKEDGTFHGSWVADTTNINVKMGKLLYYYTTELISDNVIKPGIANFDLERECAHLPPKKIIGFSSDLTDGKKLRAFEEKISDKTIVNIHEAIEKAKFIYENNKLSL